MTKEQALRRAEEVYQKWRLPRTKEDFVVLFANALLAAVAVEREACAKIVEAGGDGVGRLETAIQLGPNAAIAEAIRARGEGDKK